MHDEMATCLAGNEGKPVLLVVLKGSQRHGKAAVCFEGHLVLKGKPEIPALFKGKSPAHKLGPSKSWDVGTPRSSGSQTRERGNPKEVVVKHWASQHVDFDKAVDGQNPAPRKKFWKDDSPANTKD